MACGGPLLSSPLYPLCFLTASKAFFRHFLPVFVFFSLLFFIFTSLFAAALCPIELVLCHASFSSSFDVHFADVSDCFLRGDGFHFLATQILGFVVTMTLKSTVCCFHCVCWLISLCALQCVSLFWLGIVLHPALLCTVSESLLLVACSKIQTNRWCWIIHPSE